MKTTRTMKEIELTTVEWLYQHLFPKQLDGFSEEEWSKIDSAFKQAKEMEKEQIIDFTRKAVRKILDEDRQNPFNLEQYYNETYGGNK